MVTLSQLRLAKEEQQGTTGLDSSDVSAIAGSGVDVFDTLDSLPSTGLTAGDEAFVKSNNRLYVSNGDGWDNVALVNRSPRWDSGGEPEETYTIADSATPLTIIARATDSDNPDTGLVNQSVVSDSAQYMVTIANDSSVWTFTPKSADSIGQEVAAGNLVDSNGDFVYTFKWSDGVNFVAKATTIAYNPAGGGAASPTGFNLQLRDWGNILNQGSVIWPVNSVYNGTKQAPDGKYYMFGYLTGSGDGGWLAQLNDDGTLSWIRAFGSYYNRMYDVEFDGNDPIVLGQDYGWGQNYSGSSPVQMYMAKFNTSGTRQWSKIFRSNTITNGNYATGNSSNDIRKDSMGNFWSTFNYSANQDSPVNYTYTVPALMKFNGSGVFQGCFLLPANGGHHTASEGLFIDENDNLYMTGRATDPNSTSYPHGVVHKFTLSNTGVPSYSWSRLFGQNSGGAHYDVPNRIFKSSDGNVIVTGYTQQSNVNNDYYPIIMKMSDTDGSIMWKKRYDGNYGQYGYASAIDNNDTIWLAGEKYNNSTATYGCYVREISATDGSHIAIHEIDFTGQANVSVDNSGSYTWSQWRFGDPNMEIDINGNALLTTVPNGNGFDYRPTVTKFASPMITGTFGGGTGTYSGNQTITTLSVTPTDYTYDGTFLTYANWSTINSQGGQFSMVNYNSGSENDTVFTPTVTGQHGAIT